MLKEKDNHPLFNFGKYLKKKQSCLDKVENPAIRCRNHFNLEKGRIIFEIIKFFEIQFTLYTLGYDDGIYLLIPFVSDFVFLNSKIFNLWENTIAQ